MSGKVTRSLADRFNEKVQPGPDCWMWTGSRRPSGCGSLYGIIWVAGKQTPASQVAWMLKTGLPWPDGMDACHSCDNGLCVNPDHIWPGTRSENMRDSVNKGRFIPWNRGKTHCLMGHPLSEENVYRPSNGDRLCRECRKRRDKERKARLKRASLSPQPTAEER